MDYSLFDFLKLLGSLGMFLYGMKIMSEGLQKIAGDQLRKILSAMTKNRVMGVLTGILVTALIQSSSATTVMVVSFVNAGLITLVQSIGIIMGANIGTTATAWLISLLGFGKFSISIITLPLIGIGLPFIFSSKSKRKAFGEFIFGFAFLFLGLDYLKDSMPDLQSNPDVFAFIKNYGDMGYKSTFIFLLFGTILTVIVQSSSATVALTLIMCSKGWISFESAAAMIMGENIGTTITANIAALSANISAKRAAFAHFLFNVLGVIWMLCLFNVFVGFVENFVASQSGVNPQYMDNFIATLSSEEIELISNKPASELTPDLVAKQQTFKSYEMAMSFGLAFLHTLFNVANVLVMIWFVPLYEKICIRVIRPAKGEEEDEEFQLQFISSGLMSAPELSILQAEKETEIYARRTNKMFNMVRKLAFEQKESKFEKTFRRIEKYEGISNRMDIEIGSYLSKIAVGEMTSKSYARIATLTRAIGEIESIGDTCFNIARHFKRRNDEKGEFSATINENLNSMFTLLEEAFSEMRKIASKDSVTKEDLEETLRIELLINDLRNVLKIKNIEDVNKGLYSYQDSVFYIDIISECENMGNYIINVVEAFTNKASK